MLNGRCVVSQFQPETGGEENLDEIKHFTVLLLLELCGGDWVAGKP